MPHPRFHPQLPLLFGALLAATPVAQARKATRVHTVRGYFRRDGSYVRPHMAGTRIGGAATLPPLFPNAGLKGGSVVAPPTANSPLPKSITPAGSSWITPALSPHSNGEGPQVYTYPQDPTLEPSWVRQQKLEARAGLRAQPKSTRPKEEMNTLMRCVGVPSGDTIQVRGERGVQTIRLFGIEAPGLARPFYGPSKNALSKLVLHQDVSVYSTPNDKTGHATAWVFVGKTGVNAAQVKSGMAKPKEDKVTPKNANLAKLEMKAKAERLGIWGG